MTGKKSSLNKRQHEGTEAVSVVSKTSGVEAPARERIRKVPCNNLQDIQNPGRVRVEGSVTRNKGNYESIRVGVCIDWPCAPTTEDLDKTYVFLSERVEALIIEELENANSSEYLTV